MQLVCPCPHILQEDTRTHHLCLMIGLLVPIFATAIRLLVPQALLAAGTGAPYRCVPGQGYKQLE